MAYVKTNWVDNTTPIDENNLNKIEKGIYDNSLVVDAVTNKLNPTDTETYKTAELTEGQITDVIGVNDVIIKGQTEQDGTPTPSAPVDVNVVSGSNVIKTSGNKNLFNKDTVVNQSLYSGSVGQVISLGTNANTFRCPIFKKTSDKITISANDTSATMRVLLLDKDYKILSTTAYTTLPRTIDTSNCEFIAIFFDGTTITINNNIQIEQNSTATTYEPHQGKELPLDLPVENLFDKSLITSTSSSIKYIPIQCQANTNYTLSTNNVASSTTTNLFLSTQDSGVTSANNGAYINSPRTINSGNNTTIYVGYRNDLSNNWIQLEKGSKANHYTSFGITPIELCKIGDYQDYFYKSGSKWYLHKGVNKITSYNGETITTSYISTTGELSTGAKVYYALATATNTEITNTTLISQLEAIYNAPLYEQTNITQANNDLPMVLDITACKDNINGIKAFIRK